MTKSPFDLQFQNKNTEAKIVASLERISQAFKVLLWNTSKEYGLSPIQIQVLIFLLHHTEEKRKVSYLADEFNMTKATLSDTIKTLEQKKLIKKVYGQPDTRSYIIQLTRKGEEMARSTSLYTKEMQTPVSTLRPAEKEKILLFLLEMIRHLNQSGIITIQRMCFTCNYYQYHQNRQSHFCRLLNTSLTDTDIRIDCPEYKKKKTEEQG